MASDSGRVRARRLSRPDTHRHGGNTQRTRVSQPAPISPAVLTRMRTTTGGTERAGYERNRMALRRPGAVREVLHNRRRAGPASVGDCESDGRASSPWTSSVAARAAGAALVSAIAPTGLRLFLHMYQRAGPNYLLDFTGYDDGVDFGSAVRLVGGALPYRDFVLIQPPGISAPARANTASGYTATMQRKRSQVRVLDRPPERSPTGRVRCPAQRRTRTKRKPAAPRSARK